MTCIGAWSARIGLTVTLGCVVLLAGAGLVANAATNGAPSAGRDEAEESIRHNNSGGRFFEQGDLEAAAREFREAIRVDPEDPAPHNNLGMLLHVLGEPAEALAEFREAVRLHPGFAPGWSNLGFAFYELDQLVPAVEAWLIAVDLNRQSAGAWAGLALGLLAAGALSQAIESYGWAISLDPRYADLAYLQAVRHWSARALERAGLILRQMAAERPATPPNPLM